MKTIVEIASWTILAALAVLIIMNADKFATAVSSVGSFWTTETSMFTGSNYNTAQYGKAA